MRFFEPVRTATVEEIATLVDGSLVRGGERRVRTICSLEAPADEAIGFAAKPGALKDRTELPGALLVTAPAVDLVPEDVAVVVHDRPNVAFAAVGRHLYGAGEARSGLAVHPGASVDPSARLEGNVGVGPGAVIDAGVEIGSGTTIGPGAVIGPGCRIGRNCVIGPHVTLTASLVGDRVRIRAGSVVGDPGFGYVPGPRGIDEVVQVGRVILQDDVHVGANACIDRGALGDTVIGEGTKIGNMQQIAHNVRIGRHCIIVGNGGIAGSAVIGDGATLAGGVFTIDHATVEAGATVAGCTLVKGTVPAGETWGGIPARPIQDYLREVAEANARARKRKADRKA